ncbi:MAG: 4-hydroxybenzoate octaprenyltransferase [Gammaproteobacteria bacterium]|nr:4-hydroxybenzoate octaprenyltransferase [Gammaproteobacteria bacterium]
MNTKLILYVRLMRLDKPVGILLLLWPTLWALWIAADGMPDLLVLLVFAAGVVLMRSAGCVINDFADRKIDPHVQRTRQRPLATGEVSVREALILFSGLCITAFLLVLLMNTLTILLSLGAVVLATIYPFMKRYTHLPQIVLGAAFAWAIPMAFAAQTGEVRAEAWLLFVSAVCWTVAYDTMYAMVDREDDLKIGVKSTAILFGQSDRLMIAIFQILMLIGLLLLGLCNEFGVWYFSGLLAALALSIYQQVLIAQREPARCFQAFLNNHWLGLVVFIGIVFG